MKQSNNINFGQFLDRIESMFSITHRNRVEVMFPEELRSRVMTFFEWSLCLSL